jgi:transcription elongation factor Elf1
MDTRTADLNCPVCGFDQVDGGSVEIDGTQARQSVTCLECDASWTDVYELVNREID